MSMAIGAAARVASFLTTLVLLLPVIVEGCKFPEWTRSNGTQREWRSVIRSQNSEFSLQLTITATSLKAVASDSFAKSFTRYCIQEYPGGLYLVAQKERGKPRSRYTCMTFLKRAEGVMQLSAAPVSDDMDRRLCEKEFVITDWLVVDINNALNNRELCTLKGGYDMTVFDKAMGKPYCDGYRGETRLESECTAGDSLTFQFRQQVCVPEEMYMYSKQRTYCLANWESADYNFTLLRHDRYNYMWLMRYPKDGEDSFTVHVFKDLYAPQTRTIIGTYNYLQISVNRRPNFNISTICEDDYEICSVLKDPCTYSDQMALTCPKTCGVCNQTVPAQCDLPAAMSGLWADAAKPDKEALAVTSTSVQFIATEERMACVNWGTELQSPGQRADSTSHFMFVSSSHKGCGPRYSCAKVAQVSPHVMYLQVSLPRSWPLLEKAGDPIDCSKFVYDADHSLNKNRYRGRHVRMLVSMEANISSTCDLSDFSQFQARFENDVSCKGQLVQPTQRDSMTLEFDSSCPSSAPISSSYTCMELGSHPVNGEEILVTRDDAGQIHCWLFPARPRNHMQLILGSDCDEAAPRRIKKGRLQPLVTLVARKVNVGKSKETEKDSPNGLEVEVLEGDLELGTGVNRSVTFGATSYFNHSSSSEQDSSSVHESKTGYNSTEPYTVGQTVNVTLGRTNTRNYSTMVNYTLEEMNVTNITLSSQDTESTSPVLVTALVFTLVIVQLTLICTCRCISS